MGEAFSSPQMLANPWPGILPGCFPLKPASYPMVIRSGGTAVAFQCNSTPADMDVDN
ncbi:hypothetical protein Clacol_007258 [Clathrus columnatus]|uniref:Uncharacterized protein n=1 Tax=Clathrus columnatus TaxID=1419009 RepID=A0AAV5AIP8_9AGAM|nr:hypothetical protein Clacol_007258 [Clathrus columnatus]